METPSAPRPGSSLHVKDSAPRAEPAASDGQGQDGTDVTSNFGRVAEPGLQRQVLEVLASARRYNEWIASLALPHLGGDPIEIGSGLGDQATFWLRSGVRALTLSDSDARSVAYLAQRFSAQKHVVVRLLDITDAEPAEHSTAVAINVLEHTLEDQRALRALGQLVRPGGRVVVFVPAFEFAMSRFDREIGHVRRYTKATLIEAFIAAGIQPVDCRYINAPGLIAWMAMMKLLRRSPADGRLVRLWDAAVVPITRAVEARWQPPFGQSVLGVGLAHINGSSSHWDGQPVATKPGSRQDRRPGCRE